MTTRIRSLGGATRGRTTLLVAVADVLVEGRRATAPSRVVVDGDLALQYAAQSAICATDLEPDIRIAVPRPDAYRRPLFMTLMGELVEQDDALRLYIDGAPQEPGRLLRFGSGRAEGQLQLGKAAALVVGTETPGGWRVRFGVSAPVLWVYSMPSVVDPRPRLDGWMDELALRTSTRGA